MTVLYTKSIFRFYLFLIVVPLVVNCSSKQTGGSDIQSSNYDYDVEEKLDEIGIELGDTTADTEPSGNFVPSVTTGNLVFLGGHGPQKPEGGYIVGKIGQDITLEKGKEAARLTAISMLTSLKREIKDLNKVKRIVKVSGMVNATTDFTQHPQVIDGFSNVITDVFGERGIHARFAVGMGSLPFNIPVEIEMIVEVED